MFPIITHIDELREHVGHKEEVRFSPQPDGTTVVCYMVGGKDTFDSAWARECRGLVFDAKGNLICRPLHKFFNLNENAQTQKHVIDWTKLRVVMDKLDGSMLTPYLLDGRLTWKTKKTALSDVAKLAAEYAETQPHIQQFARDMVEAGFTPIFEFISPVARIVVGYDQPELRLLHLRKRDTGEYTLLHETNGAPNAYARELMARYGITIVKASPVQPIDALIEELNVAENIEGDVLFFENGDMVKVKCPWYRALHHSISFLRERDIAAFVLDETLDDIKGSLVELGIELSAVEEVETKVVTEINSIRREVEALAAPYKGRPPKDFALAEGKHPLFPLAMDLHRGKDVLYLDYFRKWRLKSYSLRQLPTRPVNVDLDG